MVEPAGVAGHAALIARPALGRGRQIRTVLYDGNLTSEQARDWPLPGG
jgi:hypothetical protein